ncbi:hypothetical protein EON65_14020 [archaeon]|nr:MAG: hypothetical protein EON65_14020 [archaeon]
MNVERRSIRGHRAEVTCLDCSSRGSFVSLVASGSEDRTVRLWDTASNRSVKCLHQCFTSSIEQVKFSKKDDYIVYVASVNRMYCFDLRKDSVLDSVPLCTSMDEFHDICTMELSPTNNCMVLSDDSDVVCKVDIDSTGCFVDNSLRKFRTLHTNSIGALAFADKKSELYSGGFDFSIVKWDLDSARPIKKLELSCFETVDSSNQMFNPPFVTQLLAIEDVPVLIATLGDGSVSIGPKF